MVWQQLFKPLPSHRINNLDTSQLKRRTHVDLVYGGVAVFRSAVSELC